MKADRNNGFTRCHLSHIIRAGLFSVILMFGSAGISLPLQPQNQVVYATSQEVVSLPQKASTSPGEPLAPQGQAQEQAQPPNQTPQSTQALPSDQVPPQPRPICNPNSPTLQSGSTGAKVSELQRVLTQIGYGSLLGQSGIDGKFGTSTQNAVKKFQQDYRIPVDGKVGFITWGALCRIVPNSLIIQLKSTNPEIIGSLRETLAAAGGTIAAIYDQFRMFNVRFEHPPTGQYINSLRAHPAVQGVFYDATTTLSQSPQPPQSIPTGIDRVDADLSGARSGDRVGDVDADIAIIDSGVTSNHPDLNVFQCLSFLTSSPVSSCNDEVDHGTHVAGIAAARDNNIGVVGTVPGARIWALKINAGQAEPLESDIIKALNYVAANAKDIEVVNLSIGEWGFQFPEWNAIREVISKGVAVVVAAGNQNTDAKYRSPAMYPFVITVAAITDTDGKCQGSGSAYQVPPTNIYQSTSSPNGIKNPDDFFASYSNFGSVVDLAAPGSNIESTNNIGGYSSGDGTSLAAPHVAGAVALYRISHTNNPIEVESVLKSIGTQSPASSNPQLPCDGAGRGYFDDRYLTTGVPVITDQVKEPLLYMRSIR